VNLLSAYLVAYGVLALAHLGIQLLFGHLDFLRQKKLRIDHDWTPSVTVVVPVFNEEIGVLDACLGSIQRQDYPDLQVLVVDDGSANREQLMQILEQFSDGRFRVLLKPNGGKRDSQRAVLAAAGGDVLVTVDSDTVLEDGAMRAIVQRFADPRVGAVTSEVTVENRRRNLLTRMIGYRYWSAFNQERAAQSLFKVVMCCSGPFSAYRRELIDDLKDEYAEQRFLGQVCTFGDDRHLTNLVLRQGHQVVFDSRARARTHVPTTLPQYLRQQTRWNKSFYREMLVTARFAHRRHPYMGADLICQAVLPFMLITALLAMLFQAAFIDVSHLWEYALVVVGIALARSFYGMLRTHDPGFLLFVLYGFLHVLVLIPVRLYSLATLNRSGWGTRGGRAGDEPTAQSDFVVPQPVRSH
jgi:hyaluronan synthase/N-acetylglucosaminyltransferase